MEYWKIDFKYISNTIFSDQRPLEQINVRRFCSEACQRGHVKVIFFSSLSLEHSIGYHFRNILTKNDAVGNVIHVVMLLYSTKQHVLLVHQVFGTMRIILVIR